MGHIGVAILPQGLGRLAAPGTPSFRASTNRVDQQELAHMGYKAIVLTSPTGGIGDIPKIRGLVRKNFTQALGLTMSPTLRFQANEVLRYAWCSPFQRQVG